MIDILRFMYPNASDESLISGSNFFVLMGWCFIFIGASGLVVESIGQRRLFYEAFPLIICGLPRYKSIKGLRKRRLWHRMEDPNEREVQW